MICQTLFSKQLIRFQQIKKIIYFFIKPKQIIVFNKIKQNELSEKTMHIVKSIKYYFDSNSIKVLHLSESKNSTALWQITIYSNLFYNKKTINYFILSKILSKKDIEQIISKKETNFYTTNKQININPNIPTYLSHWTVKTYRQNNNPYEGKKICQKTKKYVPVIFYEFHGVENKNFSISLEKEKGSNNTYMYANIRYDYNIIKKFHFK